MTTLIEKDPVTPAILLIFAVCIFLIGGGLGIAYVSGAFQKRTAVTENVQAIKNKTTVRSTEVHAPFSSEASQSEKVAKTSEH